VEAELPRPAEFNSRVMLRAADHWQELPHERTDGALSFRIPAEGLTGEATVLLMADGDLDLTDTKPPSVERIRIDGEVRSGAADLELGFVDQPRIIVLNLRDAKNTLAVGKADVTLSGPPARYDATVVSDRSDPTRARAIVRLRDLPPGEYTVRARIIDAVANEREVAVSFNTRGVVFRATELPVVDDSGKLSKDLGSLGTQFYRSEEPGDYVVYELDVPKAGRYELTLVASGYPSYGKYQVSLDGEKLGEPVDSWRTALDTTGVVAELGTMELDAGPHRLRFDVVGKNEEATGHFIGWHSLSLRPNQP
jgi:hypothetical protein